MGNGHMGPPHPVNRETHTNENITFPQLRWRIRSMESCKQWHTVVNGYPFTFLWFRTGITGLPGLKYWLTQLQEEDENNEGTPNVKYKFTEPGM